MSLSVWELNPKPLINDSYIKDTERSDICSSIKKEQAMEKQKDNSCLTCKHRYLFKERPRHKWSLNTDKKL